MSRLRSLHGTIMTNIEHVQEQTARILQGIRTASVHEMLLTGVQSKSGIYSEHSERDCLMCKRSLKKKRSVRRMAPRSGSRRTDNWRRSWIGRRKWLTGTTVYILRASFGLHVYWSSGWTGTIRVSPARTHACGHSSNHRRTIAST